MNYNKIQKENIMRKILAIILSAVALISLVACEPMVGTTPESSKAPSSSQSPTATLAPTQTPQITPDKVTDVDGVFNVSQKKYDFKGNNVVILNVENTSNKAYSIQITASYKNSSGAQIKSETITFEGFAPNWSNYFVLNPEISFADFDFELKATAYSGKVLADKVHVDTIYPLYIGVMLQDSIGFIQDIKHIPNATEKDIQKGTIVFDLTSYVTSPTPITFWSTAVAFNSKGEIVAIAPDRMHYKISNETNANYLSHKGISLDIDTSDIEMLKGVTSIGSIISIDYGE